MRKFLHYALNRLVITAFIVILQVAFFMMEIVVWGNYYVEIAMALRLISFGVIIALILKQGNPAVKMAWIVPILLFPLFGGVMYLALGHVFHPKRLYMAMEHTGELVRSNLQQDAQVMERLRAADPGIANQCDYILRYANTPAWEHIIIRKVFHGGSSCLRIWSRRKDLSFWSSLLWEREPCGIPCWRYWSARCGPEWK